MDSSESGFFIGATGRRLQECGLSPIGTRRNAVCSRPGPPRPNPIGLSCVTLLGIDNGILRVSELGILDGTPLLDIKPYVPAFDSFPDARSDWLTEERTERTTADDRFHVDKNASDGI